MTGRHPLPRAWALLIVVAVVVLLAHAAVLYEGLSRRTVSAAVVAGVLALVAIKHVALLGPLVARFRRRPRR